jgi:hypothetical protein
MPDLFARFTPTLRSVSDAEIRSDPTLQGRLSLGTSGPLSVFYAPFEHIQTSAKVVIVGITPGLQQATNALLEARRQLIAGRPPAEALAAAKVFASFSGPMRTNLLEMLDFIGLNRWCGLPTASQLWDSHSHVAHFTSALRYPVLLNGKNYRGAPSMKVTPLLTAIVMQHLKEEAVALRDAVWVPLGPSAAHGTALLTSEGVIDPTLVLDGLPHPSPSNIERIRYFVGKKTRDKLSRQTNPDLLDCIRAALLAKVSALKPFA